MRKFLLLIPVLALASCTLTPAEKATAKRLADKALAIGESKLDAWLNLPPASVIVPSPAPVGGTSVAVKASGK